MAKPRKKKMGRPLEDVSLRKLVKSIREDIENNLAQIQPAEASMKPRKLQKKQG